MNEKFTLTPNKKLKKLTEEFMDYLETEYFESALHDLLDESFNMNLREFLIR